MFPLLSETNINKRYFLIDRKVGKALLFETNIIMSNLL